MREYPDVYALKTEPFAGNTKGFLITSSCTDDHYYVCSRRPNYANPDFDCPKDFLPYRGKCIQPNYQTTNYDGAMMECAKRGSIILPLKDPDTHKFIAEWATAIGGDVWVGVRNKKWVQNYDPDPNLLHPLYEEYPEELTHSDGEPFDPKVDYNLGLKKWKTECYFLKNTDNFKMTGKVILCT